MIKKAVLASTMIWGASVLTTVAAAQGPATDFLATHEDAQLPEVNVINSPAKSPPAVLSSDRTTINPRVNAILDEALRGGIDRFQAKAGVGLIMDANTGEIIASSSLVGLDAEPQKHGDGRPVNLATDGVYEIGSMFKLMTIGLALDTGKATLSSQLDARKALRVGPYAIHDYHAQKRKLNLTETFLYSSNIATARLGIMVGNEKQRAFLTRLGQLDAVDNGQGIGVTPVSAQNWNAIQHVSASFGQGIATSPLHAVASVATMVNGGYLVSPTFTPKNRLNENSQPVIKTGTSQILRGLLRKNTENGSARSADVEGYFVGGMTSTADKIKNGKYDPNSVVTTFIAAVPADDPKYVFMTLLDDPQASSETNGYRTAAWNAAVIARAVIEKAASELGLPIRKVKTHQAMR